jgi:hypothetical protein
MLSGLYFRRTLSREDERMLSEQHNAAIVQLLPVLGPLLGVAVILSAVWDYSIEPIRVATTLRVRIGLVLLGSLGYGAGRLRWTAVQRCACIYGTHAGAMIIAASLLRDGPQFGLAGITASMFLPSLVALRLSTLLLIPLTPTLFFVLLSATTLFPQVFFNSILLYLFSMGVAAVIVTVISGFRRPAYLCCVLDLNQSGEMAARRTLKPSGPAPVPVAGLRIIEGNRFRNTDAAMRPVAMRNPARGHFDIPRSVHVQAYPAAC